MNNYTSIGMILLLLCSSEMVFGALPPDEWDKMRRSGYSSGTIDEFISLDKSAAAGITQGGRNLDVDDKMVKTISDTDLVSQITIIGNGVWFSVIWKDTISPPKRVIVIDPNRLALSEGEYKKSRKGVSMYRVIDTATPLKSTVPLFAVAKMRLAELAYHPSFLKEQYKRIKQLGIAEDPRVGRITGFMKNNSDGQTYTCKWTLKGFTPKPFTNLAIFDRELNFVRAVMIQSDKPAASGYPLANLYGSILSPKTGDFVFPLPVAKELCVSQGRLLFHPPEKPLKLVNLYGAPTTSPAAPLISDSFPEWLFPGLYRFGVSKGTPDNIPCLQFTEILIQPLITGMVDFTRMREATPDRRGRNRSGESPSTNSIVLEVERFAIRYYRQ